MRGGKVMGYSLAELIDIKKLEELLSSFYNITGIPSALNDEKGNNLINVGWRRICTDFHLNNPITKSRCLHSTIIHDFSNDLKGKRYISYKCANGLQEIAAPIIVDGVQLGTILQGQFFYHKPNLNFFQKQAEKYGFDKNDYLEAVQAVPIITEKEIEPIIYFLCNLSEMMAKQGLISLSELKLKKELEIREKRFSLALKSSEYEIWDWNIENREFHFGLSWWLKNGYTAQEVEEKILNLSYLEKFMHQADIVFWEKTLFNCLYGRFKVLDKEVRLRTKSGKWRWIHIKGKVIACNSSGEATRMIGTYNDITKQKAKEEEIRYLSIHDSLTGLYNRNFFEEKMHEFNNYSINHLSVVIGDMNGLKLTNDVFGHFVGDQLIKKCAAILLAAGKENYVTVRWGGDEFAVILPNAGEEEAIMFCEKVKRLCSESPKDPIQPSIAIFHATKKNKFQDLPFLIKEAETGMYRAKMISNRKIRSNMLFDLEHSLFTRNPILSKRCSNLMNYANLIANKLNLKADDKDNFILLARFHDIGKIVFSAELLRKQGELTDEETEQLRTHSEVGYRVAESIDELTSISRLILAHHERWDGKGYPYGLAGEKIPYLARWMTVLDDYEFMLRQIPYKDINNKTDALMALKKESGLKYDPKIIDRFIGFMS